MSRVSHKTSDTAQNTLKQRAEKAGERANNQFHLALCYLLIGSFAHMTHDALLHMKELPKSRLWQIFGRDAGTPQWAKWVSYIAAPIYLALGVSNKMEQKNAERGAVGHNTISEPVKAEDNKIRESSSHKLLYQGNTSIQGSTAEIERLQSSSINPFK